MKIPDTKLTYRGVVLKTHEAFVSTSEKLSIFKHSEIAGFCHLTATIWFIGFVDVRIEWICYTVWSPIAMAEQLKYFLLFCKRREKLLNLPSALI